MNRNKGFTLIELLIVVAIIAILVAVVIGAFPRKAGAHEAAPPSIRTVMAGVGANFVYTDHNLTIIDKGNAEWTTAQDVCTALDQSGLDTHIHVTLRSNTGPGELRWEGDAPAEADGAPRVLTNLPTSSTATCG